MVSQPLSLPRASLTKGPKLQNNDYTGLLNFAEQLEAASKKLSGHYELEASTMANLRQIGTRLPNYLVNKWREVLYITAFGKREESQAYSGTLGRRNCRRLRAI